MNASFSCFNLEKEKSSIICKNPITFYSQYKKFRLNLLTGEKEDFSLTHFNQELEFIKINQTKIEPIVIHLMYEYGVALHKAELVNEKDLLAIYIEYAEVESLPELNTEAGLSDILYPNRDDYNSMFESIQKELYGGNCYQVNLTMPVTFKLKNCTSINRLVSHFFKQREFLGKYAHSTYVENQHELYLSNSPETLFDIEKREGRYFIISRPIKGTLVVESEAKRSELWQKLKNSKKDQAELYMITDLIRNDITSITKKASVILTKKKRLDVPGLIHQYSKVEGELCTETSLMSIVSGLFPGGSITGAPKKRVMEIINELESSPRGFYCGSTIFFYQNKIQASINIRSALINTKSMSGSYGIGGGVTLMSKVSDEYKEAIDKFMSFLLFFKK